MATTPRFLVRRIAASLLVLWLGICSLPLGALAAALSNPLDGLSSTRASATGITHTVSFTPGTDGTVGQIRLRFATASGGGTVPAHLNLASVTLGTVSGTSGTWSLDTSGSTVGLLILNPDSPQSASSLTSISFELNGIANPKIGDCISNPPTLRDTCWVGITTFSDAGSTQVDTGNASYVISEEPQFVFTVGSVASASTENGLLTTGTSTPTSVPFGIVKVGHVAYVSQKLTVTTNAPGGYAVYVMLDAALSGGSGGDYVSAFGTTNATWSTPKPWEMPSGTASNSNTGWIGGNTSDTRLPSWVGASGKLGPISPTPQPVAYSSGPDRAGSTIYVTYALGVNVKQASDAYAGHILYRAVSSF